MKALEILENENVFDSDYLSHNRHIDIREAIEELKAYISNYQEINSRLDNTVVTLAVLQSGNKSLVKALEKCNEELTVLRKQNLKDIL